MQHGKIIIQEAHTVCRKLRYFTDFTSYRQSPTQCLHSLVFDERFYYVLKRFFICQRF